MKKTILLSMLVLMFALTIPAAAAHFQPVGERLNLNNWDDGWCEFMPEGPPSESGTTTLTANTPFYVGHGWWLFLVYDYPFGPPKEYAPIIAQTHKSYFELKLDGETLKKSGVWHYVDQDFIAQAWIDIYNFEDGMTGVHTFQGIWGYPYCAWFDMPISECDDVNEFITYVCTVEVTFTD